MVPPQNGCFTGVKKSSINSKAFLLIAESFKLSIISSNRNINSKIWEIPTTRVSCIL